MVKIKFFAVLRQILGESEAKLNLEREISVNGLIQELKKKYPALPQALNDTRAQVAVNQEFASNETVVKNGDEVAFIPPMSGGMGRIKIQREDFSVEEEVAEIKKSSPRIGGIVVFLGTTRDFSRGKPVSQLQFEHYPGMAEKKLAQIRERALKDFDLIDMSIIHRYGEINIGENIVLIIAAAEHRKDAFAACQFCIDQLKQITPIWKKEITPEGEIWVEEHP